VVHIAEISMSHAGDIDLLHHVRAKLRAGVTFDADLHSLLPTSGEHGPSVIPVRKNDLDATLRNAHLLANPSQA